LIWERAQNKSND